MRQIAERPSIDKGMNAALFAEIRSDPLSTAHPPAGLAIQRMGVQSQVGLARMVPQRLPFILAIEWRSSGIILLCN